MQFWDGGTGLAKVRKDTGFMTNAWEIAKRLDRPCTITLGYDWHEHVALISGKAKAAQRYPLGLAKAIIEGLNAQKKSN